MLLVPSSDGDAQVASRCQLERLVLVDGELTGSQFLLFANPTQPHPSLSKVFLKSVTGLDNSDLLAFLAQVATVLVSLHIVDCAFPRGSDCEGYALDAGTPQFYWRSR